MLFPMIGEPYASFFRDFQDRICAALEALDTARFREDPWTYSDGGGGRTRVLAGRVFEKAGVNFSAVAGPVPAEVAAQLPGEGNSFTATGISLVLHPASPMVPAVHANFRFLSRGERSWFGGGADLTPYYPYPEDACHFHRTWRDVCATHAHVVNYDRLKDWCDRYFFLPHRNEMRGVGGIFFDHVDATPESWAFVRDAGDRFLDSYLPIVRRRMGEPYTPEQRAFQELRRGRYVEFNLLYDRGTAFGLRTGSRTESILMSLPPVVRWEYDFRPEPGSREAGLNNFLRPRDWAGGGSTDARPAG